MRRADKPIERLLAAYPGAEISVWEEGDDVTVVWHRHSKVRYPGKAGVEGDVSAVIGRRRLVVRDER